MDQRVLVGAVIVTVQRRDDLLTIPPLLEVVCAGVPDLDVSAAIFSFRNIPGKAAVFDRVILGLYGQVVGPVLGRNPLRQRPTHENAVVLESEIPVQM